MSWPPRVGVKFDTHFAKSVISYAPGVHAGSDSSTGVAPLASKVMVTDIARRFASSRLKVTSYATLAIGADLGGAGTAGARCAASDTGRDHGEQGQRKQCAHDSLEE